MKNNSKKTKFSESKIWNLQREYFEEAGIDAWSKNEVPHYVTSNPAMAKAYAEMALGFLRDLALDGALDDTVYLVELGTGHGRLSYHFLRYFIYFYERSSVKLPPFCYVMTDFVEENIKFWEDHHQLRDFVKNGYLDFAYFDAEKDTAIKLRNSKTILSSNKLVQPLIVIANYFFDTISQEMFYFKDGDIKQILLDIEEKDMICESRKGIMENLEFNYSYQNVINKPYKEDYLGKLLEQYRSELDESHVLFPDAGIRCIERLKSFSQKGLLLLTADKGSHTIEEQDGRKAPQPVSHGSFSLSVNYHAFKQHCLNQESLPLFCTHSGYSLTIGALIYMKEPEYRNETIQAFERFVDSFSPDDSFSINKIATENIKNIDFPGLMGILRLSGYDSHIFRRLYPAIDRFADALDYRGRLDLYQTLTRVWEMYFDLNEPMDLASEIASLLFNLGLFDEAAKYYEYSIETRGVSEMKLESQLVCHTRIQDYKKAQNVLIKLSELNNKSVEKITIMPEVEIEA